MILIFKANPLCLLTLSMLRFPASAGWVAFTKQILVFPLKDFCDFGDFCVTFAPFAFAPVFPLRPLRSPPLLFHPKQSHKNPDNQPPCAFPAIYALQPA